MYSVLIKTKSGPKYEIPVADKDLQEVYGRIETLMRQQVASFTTSDNKIVMIRPDEIASAEAVQVSVDPVEQVDNTEPKQEPNE